MSDNDLLSRWKRNNESILTGFTGKEVKEMTCELDKEIRSLYRKRDHRMEKLSNMKQDRKVRLSQLSGVEAEIKEISLRITQLNEDMDKIQAQIKDWFHDNDAA